MLSGTFFETTEDGEAQLTKGRDSGMPSLEQWESYFDPAGILDSLHLSGEVVEFGCGYGTFTVAQARVARTRMRRPTRNSPMRWCRRLS